MKQGASMIFRSYRSMSYTETALLLMILNLFAPTTAISAIGEKQHTIRLEVNIAQESDIHVSRDFHFNLAKFPHNYAKEYKIYQQTTTVPVGGITAKWIRSEFNNRFHVPERLVRDADDGQAILVFNIQRAECEIKHDYEVVEKSAATYFAARVINSYAARFELIVDYKLNARDGKVLFSGTAAGTAESKTKSDKNPAVHKAADEAAQKAVAAMVDALTSSKKVIAYAQLEKRRMEAQVPGKLSLNATFSDSASVIPNDAMDAGEKAQLQVQLTNAGPGSAEQIQILIRTDNDLIDITTPFPAGNLAAGDSKTVSVPISSTVSMPSQNLRIGIKATDAKGVDCDGVDVNIPANAMNRPGFGIIAVAVKELPATDGNDGDGKIENGERVLIEPLITNSGPGKAFKVKVGISQLSDGLQVLSNGGLINELGIDRNQAVQHVIMIPSSYSKPEIQYTIRVADIRGPAVEKSYAVPIVIRKPELQITARLINGLTGGTLVQGAKPTCRFDVKNTGSVAVKDASIRVHMPSHMMSHDRTMKIGLLKPGQSQSRKFTFDVDKNAPLGKMSVTVDILESKNLIASKTLTYHIKKKQVPVVKRFSKENDIAMVIGLSKYKTKRYRGPKNATFDATNFYRFLLSDEGGALPEGNIVLLTDQSASVNNIKEKMQTLITRASARQTVNIYVTTHGVMDEKKVLYLLCYDSVINKLSQTAMGEDSLLKLFGKQFKPKKIVFYLDLCHPQMDVLADDLGKRILDEYGINSRIEYIAREVGRRTKANMVTFSASSAPGYSLSGDRFKGSIFNYCLMAGLKGEANKNGDKWISADELYAYLLEKTFSYSMGLQRPHSNWKAGQEILLHRLQ